MLGNIFISYTFSFIFLNQIRIIMISLIKHVTDNIPIFILKIVKCLQ